MHNQIKGIKEVFLPPYPKESSQEMVNYLREVERNLRELSRRAYIDTESSFTDVGGVYEQLEAILEEIEKIQEETIVELSDRLMDIEIQVSDGGPFRPIMPYLYQVFFDTNLGKPIWWTGEDWVDSEGNIV